MGKDEWHGLHKWDNSTNMLLIYPDYILIISYLAGGDELGRTLA